MLLIAVIKDSYTDCGVHKRMLQKLTTRLQNGLNAQDPSNVVLGNAMCAFSPERTLSGIIDYTN